MTRRYYAVYRITAHGKPRRISGDWTREQAAHQCALWQAREVDPGYRYVVNRELLVGASHT